MQPKPIASTIAFDRARMQEHWPALTDDDFARIGNDREALVRAIEERCVCDNLEAEEQVVALEDLGSGDAAPHGALPHLPGRPSGD